MERKAHRSTSMEADLIGRLQHIMTGRFPPRLLATPLFALFVACQSPVAPPLPPEAGLPADPTCLLGPGADLEIKFYYTPELDTLQRVRSDGRISLQLLGDVDVSGLTPGELRDQLMTAYGDELDSPEIAVIVQSQPERHIVVGGEVRSPGLVPMPQGMTVFEAVLQAGGPNLLTANVEHVVIVRQEGGAREAFAVNLGPTMAGAPEERPFYLQPRDLVYVPRSRIVDIDQWIDQNINQLIPRVGLRYTRPVGAATGGFDTATR